MVWAARYDAWGGVRKLVSGEVDQPLRLQGQYFDAETGLSYNRFRYYDPNIGSFISQDPLGLVPGENVYAFGPNVHRWIDPLGLCKKAKADFYVRPNGEIITSTGYRYMSRNASYIEELKNTMEIPANPHGTYFSFDKFDIPMPGKLQVPHDASIRGSFDTLQIIDDIKIPNGQWGKADWLEPITKDFPKFGPGGATQAITKSPIHLDSLIDLSK